MSGSRARVLGVGIAVLDIVNEVATYPIEDAKVRASAQDRCLGGNVANSLGVLRQLGHACAWCGTYANDEPGREILDGLSDLGIDTAPAIGHAGSTTPTSYISLSRETGSRTIVHFRDLPELGPADFAHVSLDRYDWVHFEGRNPAETAVMLEDCATRRPQLPISMEIEKPRPGVERLIEGPQVVIFSRDFAHSCGFEDPEAFLSAQWERTSANLLLLPWGAQGAYGQARGAAACFAPPYAPPELLDTLGAGDVFNAAIIDGMLETLELPQLLARANGLAGHKCGRRGLHGVVASARSARLL